MLGVTHYNEQVSIGWYWLNPLTTHASELIMPTKDLCTLRNLHPSDISTDCQGAASLEGLGGSVENSFGGLIAGHLSQYALSSNKTQSLNCR